MKDTALHEQLLGLKSPWSVKKVDLSLADQRVVVEVALSKGQVWADPLDVTKRAHVNGWSQQAPVASPRYVPVRDTHVSNESHADLNTPKHGARFMQIMTTGKRFAPRVLAPLRPLAHNLAQTVLDSTILHGDCIKSQWVPEQRIFRCPIIMLMTVKGAGDTQ